MMYTQARVMLVLYHLNHYLFLYLEKKLININNKLFSFTSL